MIKTGHVVSMGDVINTFNIFVGKLNQDGSERNKVGLEWIYMAQDRD